MNMRLLAGLLFAVSVVGFSLGASLPLVSLRLQDSGANTLQIGIMAAIPAAPSWLMMRERVDSSLVSRRPVLLVLDASRSVMLTEIGGPSNTGTVAPLPARSFVSCKGKR